MSAEEHERVTTVLLADDHPSVRAGLRLLLETADRIEVLGEAADGQAAVQQVRALAPDVVLMDARMPGTDGIAATRRIVAETDTEVLMLTTFDLDEVVFGALQAGAAGFLLKSAEPSDLIQAIHRVAAGDGVVAPEVTRKVLQRFAQTSGAEPAEGSGQTEPPQHQQLSELTPREQEVLAALGRGLGNSQIAQELFVAEATVKSHVSSLLAKLHLTSRMQAAVLARQAGLDV
ncbi:response regulator [Nesterenkonia muleiensis]|uniref:response regulator n=1 Tax=Nesterenkonia muleiensis TaxID=2282648 RepID=UPI000E729B47|nr:response regulator transcription factor [Nesterenkonia muleiensis]